MIKYDELRDELYYSGDGKNYIKVEDNALAELDLAAIYGHSRIEIEQLADELLLDKWKSIVSTHTSIFS